jgi:hypothetical protein
MLAVDASFATELCLDRMGDEARFGFAEDELVAPALLWSEVPSVMHELAFRGEISAELSDAALRALVDNTIGVREVRPANLITTACSSPPSSDERRPTTLSTWQPRSCSTAAWSRSTDDFGAALTGSDTSSRLPSCGSGTPSRSVWSGVPETSRRRDARCHPRQRRPPR